MEGQEGVIDQRRKTLGGVEGFRVGNGGGGRVDRQTVSQQQESAWKYRKSGKFGAGDFFAQVEMEWCA